MVQLGQHVTDTITNIEGVAIGRAEYITGCNQVLVQPQQKKPDGDVLDSRWFDEQRLTVDDEVPVLKINNGTTPGADKPAPRI